MKKKSLSKRLGVGIVLVGMVLLSVTSCSSQQSAGKGEALQTLPLVEVSLENMEAFRKAGPNWSLTGDIRSNPHKVGDLRGLEGTGILVNNPGDEHTESLVTKFEHGDIELELDFLLPKGSNSGIYLMGRYEIQLSDSWGSDTLTANSCGGIYQPNGGGVAPAMNACRASGLWNHLKVIFRAPEFDETGQKTVPATFKKVWINGVLVQKNVEVHGPTPGAYFEDEQSKGPLVIQAKYGPVAIKNICYKKYDKKKIGLTNLSYTYFPGSFHAIPNFDTLSVAATVQVDSLTAEVDSGDERFALQYTGKLKTPNAGTYLFKVKNAGMVRLAIDGEVLIDQHQFHRFNEVQSATVELDKGMHSFLLEYIDHPKGWLKGLALFGEGPQLRMQKFHTVASVPNGGKEPPPIIISTEDRVHVIRSFGMHENLKRTHVVNVGSPANIHYNYDMGQMALLHVWNGSFINTSAMWIGRGASQLAEPLGPVLTLDGLPSLAGLENADQPWPDSVSWDHLELEGYRITEKGWPIFQYKFDGVAITDLLVGATDSTGRRLIRTVTLKADSSQQNLWFHLASGKEIYQRNPGVYVIDNRSYYLKIKKDSGGKVVLRQNDTGEELLIPVLRHDNHTELKYIIVW